MVLMEALNSYFPILQHFYFPVTKPLRILFIRERFTYGDRGVKSLIVNFRLLLGIDSKVLFI